jgi:hypothetical protein
VALQWYYSVIGSGTTFYGEPLPVTGTVADYSGITMSITVMRTVTSSQLVFE